MASDDAIDLRRALETDEIVPYFQPLVELRTGLLWGFEALARWQHPQRGLIPPNEFIPLAENSGLHGLLTGKLLTAVFAAAKDIPDHLTLSVNISLTQLTDLTLPRHVFAAARQANFPLHRLVLEITESALVTNAERAARIANELKDQGSRLALDDFGTGYSSLRHLQLLPFDELKIDASFVRAITHNRESRKIAAAIVGLGNSLSLTTVAEGVETQAIADMLLWLGCDIGQGWLYGRPVTPAQLPEILAERINSPLPPSSPEDRSSLTEASLPLRLEGLPTQRLAQLNAIYDGAPVGLCFLDRNLRFVSVNKRLAEMHNLPVASHLGRHITEILLEKFSQCEPYLLRALEGEPYAGLEIHSPDPRRPGTMRTFLMSFQPARDEVDEVIGISISVVDITARKTAEEALAESEDHYRHAVELNPQVPWTANPDGSILDVSQRGELLTGLSKEEMLGVGWLRILHPDDLKRTLHAWNESVRTGNSLDIEYRILHQNVGWRWMRSRASPRRGEDGEIIRWYGTVEDIDDHKNADEALRRSEANLHAIFDAVPIGIIIVDAPDGRVVMANPRAEQMLRTIVSPSNLIDDYCRELLPNSTTNSIQSEDTPLADAMMEGRPFGPIKCLRTHKNGENVWISLSITPVTDEKGNVSGGIVAIQDIDEDKREMERLSELADILKNKLATHR
ncbi:MAG TPA: EAL domain-containing protein [Edaphobacter sp.]|jgi:PAS domain S-box-containing protein|nr:EAL domain-containing protein [Edaphobacter sp.]